MTGNAIDRSFYFFLFALAFLSGVFYASLGLSLLFALIPAAVTVAVFFAGNIDVRVAVFAGALMFAGCAYYLHDDAAYQAQIAAVPHSGSISGMVSEDPKRQSDLQSFYLKTKYGTIAIQTKPEEHVAYGDSLAVSGKVEPPVPAYFGRHVVGLLRNPSIAVRSSGGNPVLVALFHLKNAIGASYHRVLDPPQAALLFGILFGVNDGIPKDLAGELELSGLRFITAIDGLHMQIVIFILFGIFASLLPRRWAYLGTFVFVALFVALTGFTIPGLRSSAMAALGIVAKETKRVYVPHTILAAVALVLTLINPKVLLFDAGFQLSFVAVIAIVYFLPVLRRILHLSDKKGFLNWRESFLITIAVQLATAPIVILQFQSFSIVSFVASIAIVWMLPYIMMLGFLLAAAGLLFYPLAWIVSGIMVPMMDYCLLVISLFAKVAVSFNPPIPFTALVLYWGALIVLMYWYAAHPLPVQTAVTKKEPSMQEPPEVSEYAIVEMP